MNGQSIKKGATKQAGLNTIPDDYALESINRAMLELAIKYDTACKKDISNITTNGKVWEVVGSDVVAIKRAYKVDGNSKITYNNFLYENGQIQFNDKGDYEVEYIRPHDEMKNIINTPEINSLYHVAIVYYVAYDELCRVFMHEDTNKDYLLERFYVKAKEANNKLAFAKRTGKLMAKQPFI